MTKVPSFHKTNLADIDQNFNYIQQILQNLSVGDNFDIPVAILKDEKASGIDGGSSVSSWLDRDINTINQNQQIAQISSSSTFRIKPGKYLIYASAPAYSSGEHRIRLYNQTDESVTIYGSSESCGASDQSSSFIMGFFSIASTKEFSIQHNVDSAELSDGLGRASSLGGNEVYTQVLIIKVG